MASLWHNNGCKVLVVAIPATNFLRTIKLVKILVNFAWLEVELLTIREINLLNPF